MRFYVGACFCFGATSHTIHSFPYTVLSWATTHATELTFIVTLLVLHWGQPNSGESCIMVESGPIHSCVVKLLQCLLLAVATFILQARNTVNQTMDRCVQNFAAGFHGAWSISEWLPLCMWAQCTFGPSTTWPSWHLHNSTPCQGS